jgi:hypothetical protein
MKDLFELHNKYLAADKRYDKKEKELREQIAQLEAKRKGMRYPHFLDFLKKLGKEILPKIKGAVGFEVYGPFGMGNECSIYFHGPGTEKKRKTICGASFRRYGDGYGIINYRKKTKDYPKGSIGEMNRMNYEVKEITQDMNIEWFIRFMRKK